MSFAAVTAHVQGDVAMPILLLFSDNIRADL